jgi:hypothetical protein
VRVDELRVGDERYAMRGGIAGLCAIELAAGDDNDASTNPILPAIPTAFPNALVEDMPLAPVHGYDPRKSEEAGKGEEVAHGQIRGTAA